jgi:hypothetical protein
MARLHTRSQVQSAGTLLARLGIALAMVGVAAIAAINVVGR